MPNPVTNETAIQFPREVDAAQELPGAKQAHEYGVQQIQENAKKESDYSLEHRSISRISSLEMYHFAIILILCELVKLLIRTNELLLHSRREERKARLEHVDKVVSNLKQQAQNRLWTSIATGAFSILSGLCPVVGYAYGDKIKEAFSVFSKMDNVKPQQFGKSLEKITATMSKTSELTGNVQDSFAQSEQTHNEHFARTKEHDEEDMTRRLRDNKDDMDAVLRLYLEILGLFEKASESLTKNA
jgi:hypothetical protein